MYINGGKALKKAQKSGFLTRLAKNQAGNVMPLVAAAVFPMAAMIGGAVDLSRIYMTQTRLQNACDAGALAARRAMTGTTLTSDNIAEGNKFFDFNFQAGSFGAASVTKTYAPGAVTGTVNGTASATLPASVMKIFGQDTFSVDVSCSSTLNIPNTDVVFVLDTSGSMAQTIAGDSQSKIAGLRQGVKDFFRELGPGTAAGPGRIRYGFVPYSNAVNVGRILRHNWVVDTHTYRSIQTNITRQWVYTPGTETAITWNNINGPSGSRTASNYSGWALLGTTGSSTVTVNGATYNYRNTGANNSTACTALNTLASSSTTLIAVEATTAGSASNTGASSPVYNPTTPPTTQTINYSRNRTAVRAYRYRWQSVSGTNGCWLERSNSKSISSQAQTGSSTRPITWSQIDRANPTFAAVSYDVSGLKGPNGTWNASVVLPNPNTTTANYYLSGTSSQTSISVPVSATLTVPWTGCIEEAASINTIVPTSPLAIPNDAKDMQIDLVPGNDSERWKPHLPDIVWDSSSGQWQGQVTGWQTNGWSVCPSAASKLQQYTSDVTGGLSESFADYVDDMVVLGGTQHDIGMIWGARMLSPDGIYASENNDAQAPGGFQIGRHLVFMTDGNMDARNQNYGPWGISRLDGRQVPTNQQDTDDGSQDMNNKHYRRMEMICNAAKAKGYTVWVIGYGLATMPQSLQNCATDSDHWALASNSTALKAKFKAIAETIGGLRLSL